VFVREGAGEYRVAAVRRTCRGRRACVCLRVAKRAIGWPAAKRALGPAAPELTLGSLVQAEQEARAKTSLSE